MKKTLLMLFVVMAVLVGSSKFARAGVPDQIVKIERIGNELIITGTDYDDEVWFGLSSDRNRLQLIYRTANGSDRTEYIRAPEYPAPGTVLDGGILKIRFFGGTGNDEFRPSLTGNWVDTKIDTKFLYAKEFPPCELYGGKGSDYLVGSSHDDILAGGDGRDTLYAGFGDDFLSGGSDSDFKIHGGNGFDITFRDRSDAQVNEIEMRYGNGNADLFSSPSHVNELYGDWNGDGVIDRGYFLQDTHLFYLPNYVMKNDRMAGALVDFGLKGDWAVVGNWQGFGFDSPGVFRAGVFYLDMDLPGWTGHHPSELGIQFGLPGDFPVVGDFHKEGIDRVGIYRGGQYHLDVVTSTNPVGFPTSAPHSLEFPGIQFGGNGGDVPIVGDWNSDGYHDVGIFRTGRYADRLAQWALDDKNRGWQNFSSDGNFVTFGLPLDNPVTWDFNKDGKVDLGTASRDGKWTIKLR